MGIVWQGAVLENVGAGRAIAFGGKGSGWSGFACHFVRNRVPERTSF